ncbi:MAG: hypothetical protein IK052_01650 [Bacteroidales bacterium]|nr:hypothetical protein [Bacteroidales bacterium]
MKKIFAVVLGAALMLSGTNVFAQLSVGAGWLNSTETTTYTNGDPDKSNFNGLYIGGQYNLPVVAGLGVAPGLYMTALFANRTNESAQWGLTTNEKLQYREFAVNVPVNVNYVFEVGRDFNIFLYAGPVFQIAVSSKASYQGSAGFAGIVGGTTGKYTLDYFSGKVTGPDGKVTDVKDGGYRNPFNIYLGGGAGIQAGQFQVIIGYDHSLMNFSKANDEKASRSQIKLGIGLSF